MEAVRVKQQTGTEVATAALRWIPDYTTPQC